MPMRFLMIPGGGFVLRQCWYCLVVRSYDWRQRVRTNITWGWLIHHWSRSTTTSQHGSWDVSLGVSNAQRAAVGSRWWRLLKLWEWKAPANSDGNTNLKNTNRIQLVEPDWNVRCEQNICMSQLGLCFRFLPSTVCIALRAYYCILRGMDSTIWFKLIWVGGHLFGQYLNGIREPISLWPSTPRVPCKFGRADDEGPNNIQ